MGMYDTGIVTCPHCGRITEEQSKSFMCVLEVFNLDEELNSHVVSGFSGEWECDHCKKSFYIKNPMPDMLKAEVSREPFKQGE